MANISTPGYKRQIGFADLVQDQRIGAVPSWSVRHDVEQGKLQSTGNPFDLAISGAGYFRLRSGDTTLYSRQGQFHRDPDGMVVTSQGYVLQQQGGGDLVLDGDAMIIAHDGTVTDHGQAVARIALERASDASAMVSVGESFFSAGASSMDEADGATIRQGMVEGSNVSLGDEMTQSMTALRQAETGARLIQLYDDLMGRAVTAFGGGK